MQKFKLFCITSFLLSTFRLTVNNSEKVFPHITDDLVEDTIKAVITGATFYKTQNLYLAAIVYLSSQPFAEEFAEHLEGYANSFCGSKQDNTPALINDTPINKTAETTQCEGLFRKYLRTVVSDFVEDGSKAAFILGTYYFGEIVINKAYTEIVFPDDTQTITRVVTSLIVWPIVIQQYDKINDHADSYGDYIANSLIPITECSTEL